MQLRLNAGLPQLAVDPHRVAEEEVTCAARKQGALIAKVAAKLSA